MFKRFTRQATLDKEAPDVHTVKKIGRTQSLTPEGFLLCTDVPVARIGTMVYGPNETPIKVGPSGIAHVTRDAIALFADTALASAHGKAIVNDHPDVDVNPTNWKELAKGIMLSPRRGTDDYEGLLVADLLVMDAATIRDVQAGKREVSLGYEADYEQTGEGEGRQTNIIVNHVALVDRGRCGPRCAIGDTATTSLKEQDMGNTTRRRISDKALERLRQVFRDAEDELNSLGGSGMMDLDGDGMEGTEHPEPDGDEGGSHTHIHIHNGADPAADPAGPAAAPMGDDGADDPMEARFQAIEQALQQIMQMIGGGGEAPPDDGGGEMPPEGGEEEMPPDDGGGEEPPPEPEPDPTKDRAMAGDSAALATAYQQLVADAEILVPGFRVPTFDSRKPRKITVDSMCALRRSVLNHISNTVQGASMVNNLVPEGRTLDQLNCAEASLVFRASAGAKRLINTRMSTGDGAGRLPAPSAPTKPAAPRTIAELNAFHHQYYTTAGKKK